MLGKIAKNFFMASPVLDLATFAMVVFMVIFALITWHTLRRDRRELDKLSLLPLVDAEKLQQGAER